MGPHDEHDEQDQPMDDIEEAEAPFDEMALVLIEEQADHNIRRVWHEGQWFFSVIDVIAILTESPRPRKYWNALKTSMKDREGWGAVLAKCYPMKMTAIDGKLRETDCADLVTMISIISALPTLHHPVGRISADLARSLENCGVYAIVNTLTQEQYIGSSSDVPIRFRQHRWLLRRGKHHTYRLQEAWNTYGEEAFEMVVLEHVTNIEQLEDVEQRYIDEAHPVYNTATVAANSYSLPHVAEERVKQVLLYLYDIQGSLTNTPLFRMLREALSCGVIKPGSNFALLAQAEASGVDTWEGLNAYLRRYQQAC